MQVGAVGAMSYTPYIYNTNTVSRASMNKIQGINDDVLSSKTDFSALSSQETTNPLRKGESLDFAGILDMQMQMSQMNASRVMKSSVPDAEATQAAGVSAQAAEAVEAVSSGVQMTEQVSSTDATDSAASAQDYAKAMQAYQPIDLYA